MAVKGKVAPVCPVQIGIPGCILHFFFVQILKFQPVHLNFPVDQLIKIYLLEL